ncbi:MAG: LptF/LptG family permease [Planctomycetaceae bacterium]|nr:LptF/LptG family permease [Planctomycetaceae bacterium]
MTKIDRYILRQFFKTLILWYVSLAGLYIVFDLFTNMDSILSAARENGNAVFAIGRYYFFRSFQFFDILISMLIMLSAMVTLATLIRHNELVPMLAAGISQLRILMPIIGGAFLITFFAVACRELLLPRFLGDLLQDAKDVGKDAVSSVEGITDRQTELQLQAENAYWKEKRVSKPNFTLPPPLRKYGLNLQAENAVYQEADKNHPAGFLLQNVTEPKELLEAPTQKIEENPVIFTPKDSEFLKENECFAATSITFDQLAGGKTWQKYGSTVSLIQGIRNPSLDPSKSVKTVIHARITQPFLDMTLLFLGLPLILSSSDRNIFKALGITALIVIAFLAAQMLFRSIGEAYENPVFGAWFPLILFVPVATYLFYDLLR